MSIPCVGIQNDPEDSGSFRHIKLSTLWVARIELCFCFSVFPLELTSNYISKSSKSASSFRARDATDSDSSTGSSVDFSTVL